MTTEIPEPGAVPELPHTVRVTLIQAFGRARAVCACGWAQERESFEAAKVVGRDHMLLWAERA